VTDTGTDATDDAEPESAESTRSTEENRLDVPETLWQAAEHSLQTAFQLPKLRPAQHKVIDRLLRQRNVLAVMPTGSGKSLCYQLTSQVLPGLTLVVSPLISLMKDQCDALAAHGILAARLDQGVSFSQMRKDWVSIQAGTTKLLFVSPERTQVARSRR